MKVRGLKVAGFLVSFGALIFGFGSPAFAHVVVSPSEVVTAKFQTFTVSVPNERERAVKKVRLTVPEGVTHVMPTQKDGWIISIDKKGSGEAAVVTSITWTGSIGAGLRDEFTFSAQTPDQPADLQWKAYQTYSDGVTVAWDQAKAQDNHDEEDSTSGPLSITRVVAQTETNAQISQAVQDVEDANASANRSLYIAVGAIVLSIAGFIIATRRSRK